jgi:hypothetical protein
MENQRLVRWDDSSRTVYVDPQTFADLNRLEDRVAGIDEFDDEAWIDGCTQILGGPLPAAQWRVTVTSG